MSKIVKKTIKEMQKGLDKQVAALVANEKEVAALQEIQVVLKDNIQQTQTTIETLQKSITPAKPEADAKPEAKPEAKKGKK